MNKDKPDEKEGKVLKNFSYIRKALEKLKKGKKKPKA